MGSPSFVKPSAAGGSKLGIGWQGGVRSAIKEYSELNKRRDDMADALNTYGGEGNIKNLQRDLIKLSELIGYQKEGLSHAIEGRTHEALLSDYKGLFTYMSMRKDAGLLNEYIKEHKEEISKLTTEEYKELAELPDFMSKESIDGHKADAIKNFDYTAKSFSNSMNKAYNYLQNIDADEDTKTAFADALGSFFFRIETKEKLEKEYAAELADKIGYQGEISSKVLNLQNELKGLQAETAKYEALVKERDNVNFYADNVTSIDRIESNKKKAEEINNEISKLEKRLFKKAKDTYKNNLPEFLKDLNNYLSIKNTTEGATQDTVEENNELVKSITEMYQSRLEDYAFFNNFQLSKSKELFEAFVELDKEAAFRSIKSLVKGEAAENTEAEIEAQPLPTESELLSDGSTIAENKQAVEQAKKALESNNQTHSRTTSSQEVAQGQKIDVEVNKFNGKDGTFASSIFGDSYVPNGVQLSLINRNFSTLRNFVQNIFSGSIDKSGASKIISSENIEEVKKSVLGLKESLKQAGYEEFYVNRVSSIEGMAGQSLPTGFISDIVAIRKDGTMISLQLLFAENKDAATLLQENPLKIPESNPQLTLKEVLSNEAGFNQYAFKNTFGTPISGVFAIPILFNTSEAVPTATISEIVNIPIATEVTSMSGTKTLISSLVPNGTSVPSGKGLINKYAFSLGNNFSLEGEYGSLIQEGLRAVTQNGKAFPSDFNERVRIVVKDNTFADNENYTPAGFEGSGLMLSQDRFTVEIYFDDILIGNIKDPLKYVDTNGKPIDFSNKNNLKPFTDGNGITGSALDSMVREYKNLVNLFSVLQAKRGDSKELSIALKDLNDSIEFSVAQEFSGVTYENKLPLGERFEITIDGEPGVLIFDKTRKGEKQKLMFNGEDIELDSDHPAVKIFKNAGGTNSSSKYINRYNAVVKIGENYRIVPLSINPMSESEKSDVVISLSDALENYLEDKNGTKDSLKALLEQFKANNFISVSPLGEGFMSQEVEFDINLSSRNDGRIVVSLYFPIDGQKGSKLFGKDIEISTLKDVDNFESFKNLINNSLQETGYQMHDIHNAKDDYTADTLSSNMSPGKINLHFHINSAKVESSIPKQAAPVVDSADDAVQGAKSASSLLNRKTKQAEPVPVQSTTTTQSTDTKDTIERRKKDLDIAMINTPPGEQNGFRTLIPLEEILTTGGRVKTEDDPSDYTPPKKAPTKYYDLGEVGAFINEEDGIVYFIDRKAIGIKSKGKVIVAKVYINKNKKLLSRINIPNVELIARTEGFNAQESLDRLNKAKNLLQTKYYAELKAAEETTTTTQPTATQADVETKKAEIEKLEKQKTDLLTQSNNPQKITAKTPSKVSVYLSSANKDGSFNKSSERNSFVEGASILAFEPIGNNRFAVYIDTKNPSAVTMALQYPDKRIEPTFEAISAFNPKAKTIQTIKPAIVELQGNKYVLIEKGEIDYDNEGIEKINNKNISVDTSQIDAKISKAQSELEALEKATPTTIPSPKVSTSEIQPNTKEDLNNQLKAIDDKINSEEELDIKELIKLNGEKESIQNKLNNLIKEENEQNPSSGNDIAEFANNTEERNESIDFAKSELQRILGISPKSIQILSNKFGHNPSLVGAFYNSAIYLANKMPKGTAYHEAFHYVFRTLLSNNQINSLFNYAKEKYALPTYKDLLDIRKSQSRYTTLTDEEIINIYYEEKLAESFRAYANKQKPVSKQSWIERVWNSMLNFIRRFRSKQDDIASLFNSIYTGEFKGTKPAFNIYTNKTAFAPMLLNKIQGTSVSKFSSEESENFTALVVSNVLSKIHEGYEGNVESLLNDSITDLMYKYDFANNELLQSQVGSIRLNADKSKYINYLLTNKLALSDPENISMLKAEALNKFKFYGFNQSLLDENYKDNEKPERIFDIGPNNIMGIANMSNKMRIYMGSITYNSLNDFGFEESKAINTQKVFDFLSRGLANTPKHLIWRKFVHLANNNQEAKEVLNRIVSDAASELKQPSLVDASNIGFKGLNKLALSNTFNMFLNTFESFKINNIQILNDKNVNSVFNANAKDIDATQLKKWATAFEFINRNPSSTINQKLTEIKSQLSKIYGKNDIDSFVEELENKSANLKSLLKDYLGIDIALDYAEYSILMANKNALNKLAPNDETGTADYYLEKIELFKDNATPISSDTIVSFIAASKSGNIYSKNDFEGSVTRLKEIAKANAIFDTSVYSTTFRNAEGELVNDKVKGNSLLEIFEQYKSNNLFKPENYQTLEAFRKAYPEFDTKDAEVYQRALKDNLLINSEFASEIFSKTNNISIISGSRQTRLKKGEDTDELVEAYSSSAKEGRNFGNQDSRAKTHTLLTLFAEQKQKTVNGKRVSFAQFILGVNETKDTTWTLGLPVKNYVPRTKKDELILQGKYEEAKAVKNVLGVSYLEDLSKLFLKEVNRIIEERNSINQENFGEKDNPSIEKYNVADEKQLRKGELPRAFDLFSFKNWAREYSSDFYNEIINNPESILQEDRLQDVYKFLEFAATKEVNDLVEIINSDNVNLQEFLPSYYLTNNEIDRNKLMVFAMNNTVNISSFRELIHGDIAYSHDGINNVFKRAAGTSASGNNHSINQSKHSAGVLDLKAIDVTLPNGKVVKIDISDGESYGTPLWKMHKLLSEGKLTNAVKEIYFKILTGQTLSIKESNLLAKEGANLNPDKDVYNDGRRYQKMSQFIITRQLTSNIISEDARKELDRAYRDVFRYHEEYLSGERTFEERNEAIRYKLERISYVWSPKPGFEILHAMLNNMEAKSLEVFYTKSSSKGVIKNIIKNAREIVDNNISQYEDRFYRKQLETSGFKTSIVDGTQSLSLMWNEQDSEAVSVLGNNETTLGQISETYKNVLAKRVALAYETKKNQIIDSMGKPKFQELLSSFKNSLEASGVNPFIAEMFNGDTAPDYNLNTIPTIRKFEAMFLNFLSEGVLKQKAAGLKLTLVSNYGFPELKFNIKDEDGNYYSEVFISEQLKHKFGLKEGDVINPELLKMLGFRIPTQDKHSMINIKVKGFLPSEYGNAVVAPSEIVYLSGADFDIDSLYVRMKAFFHRKDKQITYGSYISSEDPIQDAFAEYLFDLQANNSEFSRNLKAQKSAETIFSQTEEDESSIENISEEFENVFTAAIFKTFNKTFDEFKSEFIKNNKKQIDANIKAFNKNGDLTKYSPITKAEADNVLLDLSLKLAYNESNMDKALTPADTSAVDGILEYFKDVLELDRGENITHPYSPSSMIKTYQSVDDGKKGIGPVAVFNSLFQVMNNNKVTLSNPIKFITKDNVEIEIESFKDLLTLEGERKNEIISALLTAMTDNAKNPTAGKLGLTVDNLTMVLSAIALNMPKNDAMMIVNMPSVYKISNQLVIKNSAISSPAEQRLNYNDVLEKQYDSVSKMIDKIEAAYNKLTGNNIELPEVLSSAMMEDAIKRKDNYLSQSTDKSIKEDLDENSLIALANFYQANKLALETHQELKNISDAMFSFSRLMSLVRGTESSFGELYNIDDALANLGITYSYEANELQYDKEVFSMFNPLEVIRSYPLLNENLKVFFENRKNSSIFVLKESTPFKTIMNSIKRGIKPRSRNNGDVMNKVSNDLMSYVSNLAVKTHNDNIGNNLSHKVEQGVYSEDGKIIFKDELLALKFAKHINEDGVKKHNHFADNMFLRYIDIEDSKGIDVINSNTWTQNSDKFLSEMISSFESLMNDNKTYTLTVEGQAVNVSPRAIAGKLMNYLMFKDAVQYRSGSFVQNASPKLYKSISNALNRIQERVNEGKDFANIVKDMPISKIAYNAALRYALEPNNTMDLLYNSNLYLNLGGQSKSKGIVTFADNNNVLSINPYAVASDTTALLAVFDNFRSQDGFELKTITEDGRKKTLINFPLIINAKGNIFYLAETQEVSTRQKEVVKKISHNVLDDNGNSFATSATYLRLEISNNSIFKPYGFSELQDQLEFTSKINKLYAKAKVDNAVNEPDESFLKEQEADLSEPEPTSYATDLLKRKQPAVSESKPDIVTDVDNDAISQYLGELSYATQYAKQQNIPDAENIARKAISYLIADGEVISKKSIENKIEEIKC